MEQNESQNEVQEERTLQGTRLRDKGDVYHAISEGLYLNVFKTDQLQVSSVTTGGIYFKL